MQNWNVENAFEDRFLGLLFKPAVIFLNSVLYELGVTYHRISGGLD